MSYPRPVYHTDRIGIHMPRGLRNGIREVAKKMEVNESEFCRMAIMAAIKRHGKQFEPAPLPARATLRKQS